MTAKSHFWYNKSQRNGILFLSIVIIILQLVYLFTDFSSKENLQTEEIITFQKSIDSLKLIEIKNRKPKIYPFNPSFITDYKGYTLGMSITEIDKLLKHRKQGRYINSVIHFQKVTGVSDSLLNVLTPFFRFPDWITNPKNSTFNKNYNDSFNGEKTNLNLATAIELQKINGIGKKLATRILKFKNSIGGFKTEEQVKKVYGLKPEIVKSILQRHYIKSTEITETAFSIKDLNLATAIELKSINGIGSKLSERIIKFRKSIQGFYFEDQLNEVYGLKPEVINRLLKKFKIFTKPTIKKLNINEATFKEILHLPYIDYELTKKIFDYKDEFAEIQNLEELKKIDDFPLDKYDRIALYLTTE